MRIRPVFAVPKLLERTGVNVQDVGLWELNEAFAVQVIYCRDRLEIPEARQESETYLRLRRGDGEPVDCGGRIEDSAPG